MFGINSDERGYLGPHSVISDLRHLMSLLPSAPIHLPSYRLTHEFVADSSSRTAVLGDDLVPMREVIDHRVSQPLPARRGEQELETNSAGTLEHGVGPEGSV